MKLKEKIVNYLKYGYFVNNEQLKNTEIPMDRLKKFSKPTCTRKETYEQYAERIIEETRQDYGDKVAEDMANKMGVNKE